MVSGDAEVSNPNCRYHQRFRLENLRELDAYVVSTHPIIYRNKRTDKKWRMRFEMKCTGQLNITSQQEPTSFHEQHTDTTGTSAYTPWCHVG